MERKYLRSNIAYTSNSKERNKMPFQGSLKTEIGSNDEPPYSECEFHSIPSNLGKFIPPRESRKCDICGMVFGTRQLMLQDMKTTHSQEKKQKCEICTKTFKWNQSKVLHMKLHGNENHKCEICTKRFKWSRNMLDHMQLHHKEKHRNCKICTKSLKWRQNLLSHMKLHVKEENNHKCDICSKSFKVRRYFLTHINTYVNEKSHGCDVCSKSFKSKHDMLKHRKRHFKVPGKKSFDYYNIVLTTTLELRPMIRACLTLKTNVITLCCLKQLKLLNRNYLTKSHPNLAQAIRR